MTDKIVIPAADHACASAFALLKRLGFTVSHVLDADGKPNGLIQAENGACVLRAEDPVLLLGLVHLVERRGAGWKASGQEVDEFLGFQAEAI